MPEDVRRERKVVTVLFCDLVGFTSRAEEMDPEDVASLLGPYHARLKEELERHGGTVEKFIGDAVMALFGAPIAHEDDPERAVRAAIAIRDFAEEEEIELRVGIATGEALVTLGARPDAGETMAVGDVVNTAARLQAAAPVNGILVSEKTYDATKHAIEYAEAAAVEAKGKAQPVSVWQAVSARARIALDPLHGTPFVGRSHELALLEGALTRARQERTCQLVTLVGVPGIGKSRLVYELSQVVDRDPELISWRQGRCLPYGDGVTFWALGEIVKGQGGILETDSPEQAEAKLHAIVADPWVESHLRPLVGLVGEQELGGDRRGEAFAAWRRFLEEIAEMRPLVLVFEDLHWADESLLDFVDHVVDWAGGVPLLCVCTARPELLERRPVWGGGKANALALSLSPLTDDDTARLVGEILKRRLLPVETQAALLGRAGGNPLYAEQFARMLDERGEAEELPLPETVQGLIAARLDGLATDQKSLLQDAAVLGKVFPLGGLARVTGADAPELEQRLHALERREFVRRERQSSTEGEVEFAFRHILVRDVAYGQIPRAERGEKHLRAAEWIESLGRTDDHAEMLAYHYSNALELARAAGQETAALAERARVALREAGDRAVSLSAFAAAVRFYREALELWPSTDTERARLRLDFGKALRIAEQRGEDALLEARDALLDAGDSDGAAEAEAALVELLWETEETARALNHLERALDLARSLPDSPTKAYVLSSVSRVETFNGREGEAIRHGRDALRIAQQLGLVELQAHALNNVGTARLLLGDEGGVADLERSLSISLAANSLGALRAFHNLSAFLFERGDVRRSDELLEQALRLAERFGIAHEIEGFRGQLVGDHLRAGRWEDAQRLADELPGEFWKRVVRCDIRLGRGDASGAVEDAAWILDNTRRVRAQDATALVGSLSWYAFALLAANRMQEAKAAADELTHVFTARPHAIGSSWPWVAVVLCAVGRGEEVLAALQDVRPTRWTEAAKLYTLGDFPGAAELLAEADVPAEAYVRMRAAEKLVAEGRRAEADEPLEKALAFYRSVGATRYVREGEALLAAAS